MALQNNEVQVKTAGASGSMIEVELPQEVMNDFIRVQPIDRDAGEFTVAQLAEYMGVTLDTVARRLRGKAKAGEYGCDRRRLENGSVVKVYWKINRKDRL